MTGAKVLVRIFGMDSRLVFILATAAAFFIGAIPFAFLTGKMRGIDIRRHGSGNIGATNVWRCVGKGWGVFAFICDFLKGCLPVLYAKTLGIDHLPMVVGAAAVAGHIFTPFMRFKGGKGVATGFGMLVALIPALSLAAFGVFVLTVLLTRYISAGSILAAAFLGICVWFDVPCLNSPVPDTATQVLVSLLAILVITKHRTNILRIATGTENKFF